MTIDEQVADLRERMAGVESTLGAHQSRSEERHKLLAGRLDKIETTLEGWQATFLRFAIGAALSSGGVAGVVSFGLDALAGDPPAVTAPAK